MFADRTPAENAVLSTDLSNVNNRNEQLGLGVGMGNQNYKHTRVADVKGQQQANLPVIGLSQTLSNNNKTISEAPSSNL